MILCVCLAGHTYGSTDSTVVIRDGVAGITATSDTTNDTLQLSAFVEIEDKEVMGAGVANLVTVTLEEGDFATYAVVRYNLLNYRGDVLWSERYRIYGGGYMAMKRLGVGYVYWQVCEAKGLVVR